MRPVLDAIARPVFGTLLLAAAFGACTPDTSRRPHGAMFVGVDVSGSFFHKGGPYDDAVDFLSYYLFGHLNGLGGLQIPKDLFVGSIGGANANEPKSFHPINDFQEKSPEQIQADLRAWFTKSDMITDFNVFFKQVAAIAQKRNLSLAPITILLVTDGIPDIPGGPETGMPDAGRISKVDLSSLEFLSRNVTVRLLYLDPKVASQWESLVPRQRVRMWTVDDQVMAGWKGQLKPGLPVQIQDSLWRWIADNVDFRVRMSRMRLSSG